MSDYTLEVLAPAAFIRSNDHTHWRNRHQLTAAWRDASHRAAKAASLPHLGAVTITATVHRHDKRRYDLDGIAPTIKACIDGLRDAEVIFEDHVGFVQELTIRPGAQRDAAALVLTIRPVREES